MNCGWLHLISCCWRSSKDWGNGWGEIKTFVFISLAAWLRTKITDRFSPLVDGSSSSATSSSTSSRSSFSLIFLSVATSKTSEQSHVSGSNETTIIIRFNMSKDLKDFSNATFSGGTNFGGKGKFKTKTNHYGATPTASHPPTVLAPPPPIVLALLPSVASAPVSKVSRVSESFRGAHFQDGTNFGGEGSE